MQHGFIPLRVFFEKRGRVKYISHLDCMRAFTRALGRSGLPLWHTEGFNPHLYITFALPLPLGCEAERESFDVRLKHDMDSADVLSSINKCLPPGFQALSVATPVNKPVAIEWAEYEIHLRYESRAEKAMQEMQAFAELPAIEVTKRTKKGESLIDIKPHMKLLDASSDDGTLYIKLRLAAGTALNIGAVLYLDAFCKYFGEKPALTGITRLRLLDKDLLEFE